MPILLGPLYLVLVNTVSRLVIPRTALNIVPDFIPSSARRA